MTERGPPTQLWMICALGRWDLQLWLGIARNYGAALTLDYHLALALSHYRADSLGCDLLLLLDCCLRPKQRLAKYG